MDATFRCKGECVLPTDAEYKLLFPLSVPWRWTFKKTVLIGIQETVDISMFSLPALKLSLFSLLTAL
jgi:hypothetical protein